MRVVMGVGPGFLETFSKLGVMASRLDSAKRPCSREEILLGFYRRGKPERNWVS